MPPPKNERHGRAFDLNPSAAFGAGILSDCQWFSPPKV